MKIDMMISQHPDKIHYSCNITEILHFELLDEYRTWNKLFMELYEKTDEYAKFRIMNNKGIVYGEVIINRYTRIIENITTSSEYFRCDNIRHSKGYNDCVMYIGYPVAASLKWF